MAHPNRVYNRARLIDAVWGAGYLKEGSLNVYVRQLRKKLAPFDYDRLLDTVRDFGYRFSADKAQR